MRFFSRSVSVLSETFARARTWVVNDKWTTIMQQADDATAMYPSRPSALTPGPETSAV
jgi:hypothetical protein